MPRRSSRRRRTLTAGVLAPFALLALGGCAANQSAARDPAVAPATAGAAGDSLALPAAPREFRAVWVATVANIDWPSRPGLPMDSVHAELIALMDRAQALHLNAIILQVRPAADAIYASQLEPWSEYLTGASGRAPANGYDPLEAAVTAAHERGMELHAWFNPYRARHPSALTPNAESHIAVRRPDLVRRYGAFQWMDPGEPEVRARTLAVVLDVVRRYDVDGVHLDDYFYPYPETDTATRQPVDFPDEPSWRRYVDGGGRMSRADWRRENVNTLIRELYEGIHREKPWVRFGISPFGIWRPGYPAGQGTRFDQHEQLYADARKWIREGWVDYYTPQLYWAISRPDLSYPVLLRWWIEQNVHGRHMWPGNFTSRVPREWRAEEITDQVWVTRGIPGATGNVHFSMKAFMQNPDSLNERLLRGPYRQAALPPATPWLGGRALPAPRVAVQSGSAAGTFAVQIAPAPGEAPRWYVVRTRRGGAWSVDVVSAWTRVYAQPQPADAPPVDLVVVTPVDRLGTEGEPAYARPTASP
ncbi:MAG TPA: family 10 glycosylhydrolase [Longimicrobium sp.]